MVTLLLSLACGLSAQSVFLGISPELNAYTRWDFAVGGGLIVGYNINPSMSVGIKGAVFHNLDTVLTVEPMGFFRYYIPLVKQGLYVQAEVGSAIFFEFDDVIPSVAGALSAGWRFKFAERWFVEPVVRMGYPVIWSLGATAGIQLGKRPEL